MSEKRKIWYIVSAVALLCLAGGGRAEESLERVLRRSELSIGWGDMIAETALYHKSMHRDYTILPENYETSENQHYRYTGHVIVSYQYRVNNWFGAGGRADMSGFLWDKIYYIGESNTPLRTEPQHCYNLCFIPEAWFTWYHHPYVNLYSSIGAGLLVNGGSEVDLSGRRTLAGAAVDATIVGCSVGYGSWFGAVEIGGLLGLRDKNHIFLIGARMISAHVGIRF